MIHTRLDGEQESSFGQLVRQVPYQERTDTPGNIAVGTTAVHVIDISAIVNGTRDYFIVFRNVSELGQTIGIDVSNGVTIANAGILLYPGESIELPFIFTSLWAIASDLSGLLRRFSIRTL